MDSQSLHFPLFLCFFFCCFPYTTSMISFSFPNFLPNDNNITVSGTATKAQVDEHPSIRLTDNVDNFGVNKYLATGRAYYYKPIPLWDPVTNVTTNFTTTFEFVIRTRNNDVFLKYLNLPNLPLNLTHNVKLRDVLPEKVMMGFSAATGGGVPVQAIRSWNFSSTLDLGSTQNGEKGSFKMWLIGLIIGLVLLVVGLSFGSYILGRNSKRKEWEQCVVHRDIKSSNVMLDSKFNAKLGDFGLARFVDHGLSAQTTIVAGTRGYIAPECHFTGKFSKKSDVFSFGMVALEIACGRKAVEPEVEESKISLLSWVWELYGEGRLLEAVDETLNGDYDMDEMKCLMTTGLWCAHPDHTLRTSLRQAIKVLNNEAPLPSLLSIMPMPLYNYYAPGAMTADQIQYFTCTSKGGSTSASKDDSRV
ncbi:l-type lectin-domain containing receptor kinase ix.1 [Quercus suber]|uniref:L-type lectin-domain containing receptor kinase ix.1 n=1 Tax=Quercus suber TaxID=58331 RepID=A0AAW0LK26_QUESU